MNDTYPLGHLNISGLETGRCRYVPLWLSCKQYSPWGLLMHFAAAAAAAAVPFILQWWWARLMGTLLGPIGLQDGWASLDGLLAVAGTSHWGIVGAVLVVLSGVAPCSLLCCSLCSQWWQDDWTAARGQWCPKMTEYGQGVHFLWWQAWEQCMIHRDSPYFVFRWMLLYPFGPVDAHLCYLISNSKSWNFPNANHSQVESDISNELLMWQLSSLWTFNVFFDSYTIILYYYYYLRLSPALNFERLGIRVKRKWAAQVISVKICFQ